MTPIHFIACVLATYCTSLFVTSFSGPGHVFKKARKETDGALKEWISCPHCFGFFVAFLVILSAWFYGWVPQVEFPIWVFAVAGGNSLCHAMDKV